MARRPILMGEPGEEPPGLAGLLQEAAPHPRRHRLLILPAAQQFRLGVAFSSLVSMVAANTAHPSGANALQSEWFSGEVVERRPQHSAALLWACCRCRNGPDVEAVSFFKGVSGGSNFNVGETVWSFVSGVWFVCEHQGVNLVLIALMPRIFLRIGREGRSGYDFCGSVFRLLDDFERPALNDGAIHIHRAQELELHFLASKRIAHVFHFLHAAGLFLFGPLFCRQYGR